MKQKYSFVEVVGDRLRNDETVEEARLADSPVNVVFSKASPCVTCSDRQGLGSSSGELDDRSSLRSLVSRATKPAWHG